MSEKMGRSIITIYNYIPSYDVSGFTCCFFEFRSDDDDDDDDDGGDDNGDDDHVWSYVIFVIIIHPTQYPAVIEVKWKILKAVHSKFEIPTSPLDV